MAEDIRAALRAEIHIALQRLNMDADQLADSDSASIYRALRDARAPVDLQAIINSIDDTLDDEYALELLRTYNASEPVFAKVICQAT
jgi:hypothetical protein